MTEVTERDVQMITALSKYPVIANWRYWRKPDQTGINTDFKLYWNSVTIVMFI